MDEIEKALRKLAEGQRQDFLRLMYRIASGDLAHLDVKKLKGRDDVFRVRKGKYRIIFMKTKGEHIILSIERRNDTTYRR